MDSTRSLNPCEAMVLAALPAMHAGRPPDGAWHSRFVDEAGKLGLNESWHGAPNRWDWGPTLDSLLRAQGEHQRREQLVAYMTPEQRAGLWADPSPEAAELRRLCR